MITVVSPAVTPFPSKANSPATLNLSHLPIFPSIAPPLSFLISSFVIVSTVLVVAALAEFPPKRNNIVKVTIKNEKYLK